MVIALWIAAAVVCCGLCGYGISVAVRRAKARREQATHALTPT
jgi:hypothetical protein